MAVLQMYHRTLGGGCGGCGGGGGCGGCGGGGGGGGWRMERVQRVFALATEYWDWDAAFVLKGKRSGNQNIYILTH